MILGWHMCLPVLAQGFPKLILQSPAPGAILSSSVCWAFLNCFLFSCKELVLTYCWCHEGNIISLSKGDEREGSAKPTTFFCCLFGSFSLLLDEKHTSNFRLQRNFQTLNLRSLYCSAACSCWVNEKQIMAERKCQSQERTETQEK